MTTSEVDRTFSILKYIKTMINYRPSHLAMMPIRRYLLQETNNFDDSYEKIHPYKEPQSILFHLCKYIKICFIQN